MFAIAAPRRRWLRAPRAALSLLVLTCGLAACASPQPPVKRSTFRDANAPIWSAAAFIPRQIAGDWRQVASYSGADTAGCRPGAIRFRQEASGSLSAQGRLCLNGAEVAVSGPVTATGPGRFQVPGMGEWWVIWVDSGYRTLAIATPRGEFGFVLDRGAISPDRLSAAAEIFDFNGYPKALLRGF